MGRFWSLLFLMVPILGVLMFVLSMAGPGVFENHWLPVNLNEGGDVIDSLFYFILWLTGIIFIGTGVALFWFLWKYDGSRTKEPVKYTHGSHALEVVWSIIPAATLLFIAIFQFNAWATEKMRRPIDPGIDGIAGTEDDFPVPPMALVVGRQFEWRIQYAGEDGKLQTEDDLHTVNDLHVPFGEPVVLQIESDDVLHSFFLPQLRLKQDVVPGMRQFVWFNSRPPVGNNQFDIVCAELCGWGHYKMKGRITIETRQDYEEWLAKLAEEQNKYEFEPN